MNPESTAIVETTSDWKNLCSSDDRALLLKNDCRDSSPNESNPHFSQITVNSKEWGF
jgi:hypothetical protein